MQVEGKTLTIGKSLWVQYGGVDVTEQGDRLSLTGRDEDAYLKVLNHFGRVLKLYTFEGGRWLDADTGLAAQPFDEAQAGRLPAAPAGKPAGKASGKGSRTAAGKAAAAPAKAGASRKTATARKGTAKGKAAAAKPARSAGTRKRSPGGKTG